MHSLNKLTHCSCSSVGTTVFRATRNFEPSRGICPFLRNFYVFTEFCRIRYWTVIWETLWYILVEFRPPYSMYTWFQHEIHDCHSGCDGSNTENIRLSLSEILPINLVDRLYLSVAVTGDKYRIFGQVQRPQKINYYMWKICHGDPRNLANWPAEFGKICRGKLWSLLIRDVLSSMLPNKSVKLLLQDVSDKTALNWCIQYKTLRLIEDSQCPNKIP